MENELQKYSHFFTLDLEIKKRIYDLNYEDLDYNKAVKYSDKLYDGVSSLKNKFLKMCTINTVIFKSSDLSLVGNYLLIGYKSLYHYTWWIICQNILHQV